MLRNALNLISLLLTPSFPAPVKASIYLYLQCLKKLFHYITSMSLA